MVNKNRLFSRKFCWGMAIYAVCFLLVTAIGLMIWWDFIDTYEQSRPKTAVNAFTGQLTAQAVCEGSEDFLSELDSRVQSREESCAVIDEALRDGFRSAKKSRESTDNRQVYALLSGDQEIGEFSITAGEAGKYGFRIWTFENASFDLSFLTGKTAEVTVPESFAVQVSGTVLDDSYIVARDLPYEALEEFYGKYDLPAMVTYSVDDYLGDIRLEILDESGNPVSVTEETDWDLFLPACTESEQAEIEGFVPEFLSRYVDFSGGARNSIEVNFKRLKQVSATDGELVDLFYSALKGLRFAASRRDTIEQIIINRTMPMEDDRYFCDVTFHVETVGRSYETVRTENNMKLILIREQDGLKTESFVRY